MINVSYLKRIFSAYVLKKNSQLSFWHETPGINTSSECGPAGAYYMTFHDKTKYPGPFDEKGVPLLDYHGKIGKQYNPIAIAQYGLGNFNLYKQNNNALFLQKSLLVADWLVNNLAQNSSGQWVWNHLFDWEYFRALKSPWHSGLAQGQGISALLRVYNETGKACYKDAADRAFQVLLTPVTEGGVLHIDSDGFWWLEEYIVDPPTHILNGFMWALWGVYDYMKLTNDKSAEELWRQSLNTIKENLNKFDNGYWSLYDLSRTTIPNAASLFYHSLHIVQLRIMALLCGDMFFDEAADRWESYKNNSFNRKRAFLQKAIFKLIYF